MQIEEAAQIEAILNKLKKFNVVLLSQLKSVESASTERREAVEGIYNLFVDEFKFYLGDF